MVPRERGVVAGGDGRELSRVDSTELQRGIPVTTTGSSSDGPTQTLVIEAGASAIPLGPRVLHEHHELLFFLIGRDLKLRYKQTALGAAWAVLQPLSAMLIFTLFLGRVAGISASGTP